MFFDLSAIEQNLLPVKEVRLFADLPTLPALTEEVKARLAYCAKRWDGYVHADFGDSYGEFARNANRCNFEDLYINRRNELADLVFAVHFLNEEQYLPRITYLVGLISAEESWCVPAHVRNAPKEEQEKWPHILELYGAETAALLAMTYGLLRKKLPVPEILSIPQQIQTRMFDPFMRTNEYGWMGFFGRRVNNWCPWILSNVLLSAIFVLEDDGYYREIVKKAFACVEHYVDGLKEDCCPDEGVRYWHLSIACLFDCIEILYDITGGKVDLCASPQMQKAALYPLGFYDETGHSANFADAEVNFPLDTALLIRMGQRTQTPLLTAFASSLYKVERLRALHDNFYRQLKNMYTASSFTPVPCPTLPERYIFTGIQVASLRKNGLYFVLKGNHNNESHNHNDCGSFVCYYRGNPLFVDPGVDLYSGHTFNQNRYTLWYLRSEYHNLPRIAGKEQQPGGQFACTPLVITDDAIRTQLDGAYGLDGKWQRTVYTDGKAYTVEDSFSYAPEEVVLHFILGEKPQIDGNTLRFACGVEAVLSGMEITGIEELDLTGKNPPDHFIGDIANRKTGGYSALVPPLLTAQWQQDSLYRLVCTPKQQTVSLTISSPEQA